ncbi:hypothetical protein RF55_10910 [Lasius niger]|uniref:Uncharacterized protein n=1 Tax=Lasius niger TaxID=67767 RepID=A0A0J7KGW8_LASNI|nr:hypothetical protein RF55_10910 [Lasius niger]
MKGKWRHIRDNFLKFLNQGKSGDPASKKKKYIYADALSSLMNSLEKRKTCGNITESADEDDGNEKEKNDDCEEEFVRSPSEPGPCDV